MSRLLWFVLGIVVTLGALVVGGYLFVRSGGISMATTSSPLPLERTIASMALHASFASAEGEKSPLPVDEPTLLAGAATYKTHCALCHGRPGGTSSAISRGMFPQPPQLFHDTVTDDPVGETYWKVTNGIRLSGMPGFAKILSEQARWQVALLMANADKLPQSVNEALQK